MKEEYLMLSVEEALKRVLSAFQPLPPERIPVLETLGRFDLEAENSIRVPLKEKMKKTSPSPESTFKGMFWYLLFSAGIGPSEMQRSSNTRNY